jgi:hypothetical protein
MGHIVVRQDRVLFSYSDRATQQKLSIWRSEIVSSSRSTILPSFVQTDFQVVALTIVSVTLSAMG